MNAIDRYLLRIANTVSLYARDVQSHGLMNGKMGLALFLYEYAKHTKEPMFFELSKELVVNIENEINPRSKIGFDSGLSGIGWGLQHMVNMGCEYGNNALEKCAGLLANRIANETVLIDKSNDLYGFGLYFTKRRDSFLKENNQLQIELTNGIIDFIMEDCVRILTKKKVLGTKIPLLSLYQLNSILYFSLKIADYNKDKAITIIEKCLSYITKKEEEINADRADIQIFGAITQKTKKDNLVEKMNVVLFEKPTPYMDNYSFIMKCFQMNFLFGSEVVLIENDLVNQIVESDQVWNNFVHNLSEKELVIECGIAGLGLLLLSRLNNLY